MKRKIDADVDSDSDPEPDDNIKFVHHSFAFRRDLYY